MSLEIAPPADPASAGEATRSTWPMALQRRIRQVCHRRRWLLAPLAAFLLSRLLVFGVGVVGDTFLPTEEGHWVADPASAFLSQWAKWDSQWYVQIARDGYWLRPTQQSNVAFFPVYPLVMRLISPLLGDRMVLAGFVISNVAFLLALVVLYRLACLDLNDQAAAGRSVFYLAFAPTAFFFSAVYTESLFLLWALLCVYSARTQQWWAAAIAGVLAAATRNLGVVLWGVVMAEWLRVQGWTLSRIHCGAAWRGLLVALRTKWTELLLIGMIPLGLLGYMLFLHQNFGDALAFLHTQAAWGRQNIGTVAVLVREVGAVADFIPWNRGYLSRLLNLAALLGVLALVPFIWRRFGAGYALFTLICVLVPASSSTMSMIRYVLTLFPLYLLLGAWGHNPVVDRSLTALTAILLGLFTTIFVNWYFVA